MAVRCWHVVPDRSVHTLWGFKVETLGRLSAPCTKIILLIALCHICCRDWIRLVSCVSMRAVNTLEAHYPTIKGQARSPQSLSQNTDICFQMPNFTYNFAAPAL